MRQVFYYDVYVQVGGPRSSLIPLWVVARQLVTGLLFRPGGNPQDGYAEVVQAPVA